MLFQVNEKASDEVLEVEKKYNEIRKPVYDKRNEIISSIPDFWLTAVSIYVLDSCLDICSIEVILISFPDWFHKSPSEIGFIFYSNYNLIFLMFVQFLSHPALSELVTEEDHKVYLSFYFVQISM